MLYVGDLNSNPPEAEFTEFTAAGDGEAYDPLSFSTTLQNLTDSTTSLRYRDDYQLMTQNILGGTGAIDYVSGSLQAFGNNGSVSGSVNSGSNTDLAYMTTGNGYNPTQSQILSALTTASDHLPNVADYTFGPRFRSRRRRSGHRRNLRPARAPTAQPRERGLTDASDARSLS